MVVSKGKNQRQLPPTPMGQKGRSNQPHGGEAHANAANVGPQACAFSEPQDWRICTGLGSVLAADHTCRSVLGAPDHSGRLLTRPEGWARRQKQSPEELALSGACSSLSGSEQLGHLASEMRHLQADLASPNLCSFSHPGYQPGMCERYHIGGGFQ